MRQFPEISETFRGFIEKQKIFFVGIAGLDSDLSPRRHREREGESCEEIFSRQRCRRDAKFSKSRFRKLSPLRRRERGEKSVFE